MIEQSYQTTVSDPESGHLLHIMSIPSSVLANRGILGDVKESMLALGIEPHCSISAERLAHGITAVLELSGPQDNRIDDLDSLTKDRPGAFSFARQVAQEAQVPVVSSPLEGASLAALASVGAGLGYALAAGATPLLLVAVPAGIIVVFVSVAVAERLRDIVHGKNEPPSSGGGHAPSTRKRPPIDPDAKFRAG